MPDAAAETRRTGTRTEPASRRISAGLVGRVLRYGAGSVVATVCSQTTFLLLYGPAGASTTVSSVLAWLAGAIPNYWLNRAWTWERRGRPSLRREVLPYAAIIFGTLAVAIVATGAAAAALDHTSVSHAARTFLVAGTYFGVYVVMFGLRFLLFDRLFRGRVREREAQHEARPEEPTSGR